MIKLLAFVSPSLHLAQCLSGIHGSRSRLSSTCPYCTAPVLRQSSVLRQWRQRIKYNQEATQNTIHVWGSPFPSPVVPEAGILYFINVHCANCQILPWEKLYQTGYIFFTIIQAEFWMLYSAQSEISEDWNHFLKAVVKKKKNPISFQYFHTMAWVCLCSTSEKGRTREEKPGLTSASAQRETLLWLHWSFSQYFATQLLMYIWKHSAIRY